MLLQHCRAAKAALVMSTLTVYRPHPDPWHAFREDDPLGDQKATHSAPYSVSKIAQEAVARYCARAFELPVIVTRMGSAYGEGGGLPMMHLDAIAAGQPVRRAGIRFPTARSTTTTSPRRSKPLLAAASVPATIVNWCGDDAVSVQEWSAYFGELLGAEPVVEVTPVPVRIDRVGRRHHEAPSHHRAVPRAVARRVPAHGRALPPGSWWRGEG